MDLLFNNFAFLYSVGGDGIKGIKKGRSKAIHSNNVTQSKELYVLLWDIQFLAQSSISFGVVLSQIVNNVKRAQLLKYLQLLQIIYICTIKRVSIVFFSVKC